MNYKRIYDQLIERGRDRVIDGYSEIHHVVPRCMGGSDDPENLVRLTPEEHYVAHQLLVKIYPDVGKLIFAMFGMSKHTKNHKVYGWLRRRYAIACGKRKRETIGSNYGKMWINNGEQNRAIPKNSEIPEGWQRGLVKAAHHFVKGTCWITNGTERIRVDANLPFPEGWEREYPGGRKSTKVKKRFWITNGEIQKLHPVSQEIPESWKKAMMTAHPKTGVGSIIISNGIEQTRIPKGEPIPEGWLNCYKQNFEKTKKLLEKVAASPKKIKPKTRQQITEENKAKYKELHDIYNAGGFKAVVEFGYKRTNATLIEAFLRYVPEYVPRYGIYRGGKKRTKKNGG